MFVILKRNLKVKSFLDKFISSCNIFPYIIFPDLDSTPFLVTMVFGDFVSMAFAAIGFRISLK